MRFPKIKTQCVATKISVNVGGRAFTSSESESLDFRIRRTRFGWNTSFLGIAARIVKTFKSCVMCDKNSGALLSKPFKVNTSPEFGRYLNQFSVLELLFFAFQTYFCKSSLTLTFRKRLSNRIWKLLSRWKVLWSMWIWFETRKCVKLGR